MPALDRRLQLLLDEERYARLAAEADASGRSVAAIIRHAIDVAYPSGDTGRAEAARQLLAMSDAAGSEPGEGPADLKRALEDQFASKQGMR
ncbi:MAG: ribbon-helix-helix protein, CopG family [bacterium]|nr:ribbon-helix-helix protein, CopG family [bacterium]